jgi:hypothetical protein
LIDYSDGGANVLRDLFARSDTTLTKVTFSSCNFGTGEETSQLLAACQTNRTMTDLAIYIIENLSGAGLGNSLCGLLQNMPRLRRLECYGNYLRVEGARAMQPGL